ncbi:MAG TPA: hypothetical protein VMM13_03980 [Euzebya sp.]|nr:hypothetical protein [Euzebya sp.]
MTATISLDALSRKARRRKTGREVAAEEARRRWEAVRSAVAEQADHLSDAAGEQFREARAAAAPQVGRLRKQADHLADAAADQLRDISAEIAPQLARLYLDVKEATRHEGERIIEAINRAADEALAEAHAKERRRRVWALIGWTTFGLAAGALLASEYGRRQRDAHDEIAVHDVALDQATRREEDRVQDLRDQDLRDQDLHPQDLTGDMPARDVAVPVAAGDVRPLRQDLG